MLHIVSHHFNTTLFWLIIFVSTLYFSLPIHTSAQTPSFVGNSIYLESAPQYPEPNSAVTVSLNDYSVDALGATIFWYINGIEQTSAKNSRSIEVPTYTLGSEEIVKVVLTRPGSPDLSSSLTISPVVIDLIVEADTHVPVFYKGRTLPSKDSPMRVIALVHDVSGSIKNEYTYKWSAGDSVLFGGPLKGKNIINYTMPHFTDSEITVQVFDTKGNTVGKKTVSIGAVDPQLYFYEYSSLRGLSERAASNQLPFIGDEMTLFGEPYFINAHMDEGEATFEWMIDNNPTTPNISAPNAVTLSRTGEGGSATILLRIVTLSSIPQFVSKQLQLIF